VQAVRALRHWERAEQRAPVPIVAVTACAMTDQLERCIAAGMNDVLVKPVELGPLAAKLDRWLPLPQPPAAPAAGASAGDTAANAPIDPARLAKNCGDYPEMLAEVLAAFRRTCYEDSAGLKQAVAARDAEEARRFAHRIGGASSMVGALGLAAACASVEQACRAADWEALPGAMHAFERERGKVMAWLREQP
jgi:HPt (histidine-containing phosphotransfer) domain-containing protein